MTLRTPLLRSVPADGPDPVPVPEATPEQVPVTPEPAEPGRPNAITRAWHTAGSTWQEGAKREGGWIHFALRWQGPSVDDQRDYLRDRTWLEDGEAGGITDRAGEAYHVGIGIPAVAALNAAKAPASRPFVAIWVTVVTLFALFFPLRAAGLDSREAFAVCGCLALAPVGYIAVIMLVLAGYRERQRKRSEKK
jgi:hypothetical protein